MIIYRRCHLDVFNSEGVSWSRFLKFNVEPGIGQDQCCTRCDGLKANSINMSTNWMYCRVDKIFGIIIFGIIIESIIKWSCLILLEIRIIFLEHLLVSSQQLYIQVEKVSIEYLQDHCSCRLRPVSSRWPDNPEHTERSRASLRCLQCLRQFRAVWWTKSWVSDPNSMMSGWTQWAPKWKCFWRTLYEYYKLLTATISRYFLDHLLYDIVLFRAMQTFQNLSTKKFSFCFNAFWAL